MRAIAIFIFFIFVGCTQKVTREDLANLNGYWEIEKVIFPNGESKDFNLSTTVDYIELNDMKGFRKKMQPKFNGTFETSNDAELFEIVQDENDFKFNYKNGDNKWCEKLIEISKDNFSVINQDTLMYRYKRFQPINATE